MVTMSVKIFSLSVLNWEFLTTKGVYKVDEATNQNIYGLAVPLFGTIFIIIISLSIALTIGVLVAIFTSIYLQKNSKISNILELFVRILTGIPSLIYGIIGSILFVPLFSNDVIQFNSFSAALTISFFIMPTIIKTTQEGLNKINPAQKAGALSLGSTNEIATRKVLLKQAAPAIISASVIAIGMVIADSAIFITIYGTISQSTTQDWLQNGGTTLSTEIYKLTKQEEVLWEYVKAIGIVIILLIVIISSIASKIQNKKYIDSIIAFTSFALLLLSILLVVYWLFILSVIGILIGLLLLPIYKKLNSKFKINNKIKNFYYEKKMRL